MSVRDDLGARDLLVRVFGLTGGIASGKSTVARRFEELGVPVVYADRLARDAVAKGSPGFEAVVEAFGAEVVGPDGELDRRALGAKVFGDPDALGRLNRIVHPRVASLAIDAFAKHVSEGNELICYEVPLLVENGLADAFRPVVVIAVSPELQLERAMKRDALTPDEIKSRIASQMPLDQKLKVADFVLWNEKTEAELLTSVDELLPKLRAWSPTG
jgi:dephospho-CoA kinase